MRREWGDAVEKIRSESGCRVCGHSRDVDASHVIGRKHDPVLSGERGGKYIYVHPDSVVPLCGSFSPENHHGQYDGREKEHLDLLPYLSVHEQIRAVEDAGGIEAARRRITGGGDGA